MVIQTSLDLEAIARRFNPVAHGVVGVRELRALQSGDALELWLLSDSISSDDELRLFQIGVDVMAENPSYDIHLHVLTPDYFTPETDLRAMIPTNADLIPLQ